ncbi:helix-turn-helix domain-containing protein [Streptococcus suis]|nr:helix-turn-helix domain-containing protein [Streptococcus suis]MBY5039041.1 helix-turn-helix domain-containing protein [Streptococcus suis]
MNRLKILRKEKGETQDQVAEVAGVSKRSYIYWENSERQIKPDKAQALADHFGVSVGYLLGYTPNPKKYDDEAIIELADGSVYAGSITEKDEAIRAEQFKNFVIFLQDNFIFLTDEQIEILMGLVQNLEVPAKETPITIVKNKEKYSYLFSDKYSRTEIESKIDKYTKTLRTVPKEQERLLSILEKDFGELRVITNIRDVWFNTENDELNNSNKD